MCRKDENIHTNYNLVGFVEYEGDVVDCEGDVGGGHYVSYVRGFEIGSNSKTWYKASDQSLLWVRFLPARHTYCFMKR